jgi:hypothetical protein
LYDARAYATIADPHEIIRSRNQTHFQEAIDYLKSTVMWNM